MIILADENLHPRIAARLVADGHDLAHISDVAPSISDPEVLALAVERDALLVTNDLDFGALVFLRGAAHTGVLLLRLGEMPYDEQAALVSATVASGGDALRHVFSVLEPTRLRVRGGP